MPKNDPFSQQEINDWYNAALEFSEAVRHVVLGFWERGFKSEFKGDKTPVTEGDLAAEKLFRELIAKHFPKHTVFGEEGGGRLADDAFTWVIDPIDGTQSFMHGIATFGSMFALFYGGRPIIGVIDHPALNERFSAGLGLGAFCNGKRIRIKDSPDKELHSNEILCLSTPATWERSNDWDLFEHIARNHKSCRVYYDCYGLTRAIAGSAGAMFEMNVPLWDIAPCQILVEEAGGKYIDVKRWTDENGINRYCALFGKPAVVEAVQALIKNCTKRN